MKTSLLIILVLLWTSVFAAVPTDAAGESAIGGKHEEYFEKLYTDWQTSVQALGLPKTLWIDTDRRSPASIPVIEMLRQRVAYSVFLANKVANTDYPSEPKNPYSQLERDAHLLRGIAGIDLISPAELPANTPYHKLDFKKILTDNMQRFANDWKSGRFADFAETVKAHCDKVDRETAMGAIAPQQTIPPRRFGIFALPALAEAIESKNSRCAFAAFLIITGHSEDYSDYINQPDAHAATGAEKVARVRAWYETLEQGVDIPAMYDVRRRLAEVLDRERK